MGLIRLSPAAKWRAFDDGLVVYVPATCETYLLSLASTPLLKLPSEEFSAVDPNGFELVPLHLVQELIDLKILESIS